MLLICSAIEEEVVGLKEKLDFNFELSSQILIKTLGIGYLEAALNLQNLLLSKKNNISGILFIGTAGLYSDSNGQIANIRSVSLLNPASQLDLSYVPENSQNQTYYPEKNKFSLLMPNSIPAHCLSSLEITKDPKIIEKYLEKNNDIKQVPIVENMELYGIAEVAHKHEIPWNSVLGITNSISPNAHDEWQKNRELISKKLCDFVADNLKVIL